MAEELMGRSVEGGELGRAVGRHGELLVVDW